jgi:hypothetical protein
MLTGQSDAKIDLSTIVGLWLFDEGTGDVANDSSAKGNRGTLTNGPKWVAGKFGRAVEFDGKDDIVISSSPLGLSGNAERSVAFWIKPTSSDGFQPVVSWGVAGGQKAYWVEYNGNEGGPNTIRVCGYDADAYTKATLPLGQWHHVAVVYPGKVSETKFYYNGVSQEVKLYAGNQKDTLDTTDSTVTIGDAPIHRNINRNPFVGAIDEVAIFNVALTEDDVKEIMTKGLKAVSPAGKLVTVWGTIKASID